ESFVKFNSLPCPNLSAKTHLASSAPAPLKLKCNSAKSGYNKGTIRSDIRYHVVSKDVRRHRLISISYITTLPCHGRGREFESRRPRHFLLIGEVVSQFLTFARALVPSVLSKLKVPPQQSIILRDRACWLKTLRPDSIMLSEIHCRIMG